MKYSYSNLPYAGEALETSFARVARCGYDAIELVADVQNLDVVEVLALQEKYDLPVHALCMIYTPETDLVSSDPATRRAAEDYVFEMLKRGQRIGVRVLPVTPTACMKITAEADRDTEWGWARDAVRRLSAEARRRGIRLVIEPWNRYETYLINTLDQAMKLVSDVGEDNVGVKGDLFHMNIEESDLAASLRAAGSLLWHMDLADSNRAAPGRGHIPWPNVVRALRDIGYSEVLNFELLPAAADPFTSLKGRGADEFKDIYTEESVRFLREQERELKETST
ncbi:MAG TPA: sugar phosphate isomerase/epimerase family protein [Acidimicrobiales bacterium]|jgi:sugar phosphate isomerase/epimerase